MEWFDEIASDAMSISGRSSRTLQDAADAAPFLYTAGGGWYGMRRQVNGGLPSFYNEGTLIWLEADVMIRTLTNGRKTLFFEQRLLSKRMVIPLGGVEHGG